MSLLGIAGTGFAIGVLVNSLFEGWLLSGGSAYAWAIWLLASSASNRCTPQQTEEQRVSTLPLGAPFRHPIPEKV
jgi:hypothetical protein